MAGVWSAWIDAGAEGMHACSDAQTLDGSALAGSAAIVVGQGADLDFGILHTFVGADVTLDRRLHLAIQVDASKLHGQHLVADASHSAHFFVGSQAPVQLLSQSGHGYALSVPEPGTASLYLLALGLLAARSSAQRRRYGRAA